MANQDLWKYCTAEHCNELLLSLRLFGQTEWPREKQLACLYALGNHPEHHYREQAIPKGDGRLRVLQAPDPLLKGVQRNILHGLLDALPVSIHATAYRRDRGTLDNALPHRGAKQVLRLDIENFFDSIGFLQVYRRAFPAALFPPAARRLLTELVCLRDRLPQGAPTSPAIANRVMLPFDRRIGGWCRARGIRYTRYCDDMTFSGDFSPSVLHARVRRALAEEGFRLNEEKTLCRRAGQRQSVTGIVVNAKLQLPRTERRWLRQQIYYCERYGVAGHLARTGGGKAPSAAAQRAYLQSLLGKVSHLLYVNPRDTAFAAAKGKVMTWLAEEEAAGVPMAADMSKDDGNKNNDEKGGRP